MNELRKNRHGALLVRKQIGSGKGRSEDIRLSQCGQSWRTFHGSDSFIPLWEALRMGEHKGKALKMQARGISQGFPPSWSGAPPALPVNRISGQLPENSAQCPRCLDLLLPAL